MIWMISFMLAFFFFVFKIPHILTFLSEKLDPSMMSRRPTEIQPKRTRQKELFFRFVEQSWSTQVNPNWFSPCTSAASLRRVHFTFRSAHIYVFPGKASKWGSVSFLTKRFTNRSIWVSYKSFVWLMTSAIYCAFGVMEPNSWLKDPEMETLNKISLAHRSSPSADLIRMMVGIFLMAAEHHHRFNF